MNLMLTLFLLFSSAFGFAQVQPKTLDLVATFPVNADSFIGYDKFDYQYFIKDNVLFKVKGQESVDYKNLTLGKITKVDLLNPLKVIVFYERFNTVITLDNQLNETLHINFSEIKIPLVINKVGIALQNQMWVFDEIMRQIYLYDTTNGTLKAVGTPISEEILLYNTDFNTFEWIDENKNWYQCSVFGSVQQLDYAFDFDRILFSDNEFIFYAKAEQALVFNRKRKTVTILENIEKTFISLKYKNQILSIFAKERISNYKITLP